MQYSRLNEVNEFCANSSSFMVLLFVEGLKQLKLLQNIQKWNPDTFSLKKEKKNTLNLKTSRIQFQTCYKMHPPLWS